MLFCLTFCFFCSRKFSNHILKHRFVVNIITNIWNTCNFICVIIKLIKDIPTDGSQDYDVLGYVYEFLISNFAASAGKKAGEFYTPQEVSQILADIVTTTLLALLSVGSFLISAFIAIVFAIYVLYQKELLARQCRRLLYAFLPEKIADSTLRIMRLSNSAFSRFLSGQCIEVCILGSMFAIAMAIFNMPFIPLICVLIANVATTSSWRYCLCLQVR